MAAYHFVGPHDCYISFASAPASWKLDDGSPPPAKKPFEEPTYDAATRTFRGVVNWDDVPFEGCTRWVYEMVFSDSFAIICAGKMEAFSSDGNLVKTLCFPRHLRYWREITPGTIIGQTFVQNGMVGLASYHFEALDTCYINYMSAPSHWRLADGSTPPRRKPFESVSYDETTRSFRGTIDWGQNTFDGSMRWEYEMIFSENFDSIIGGAVQSFSSDGNKEAPIYFGRQLLYKRFPEEVHELILALERLKDE